MHDKPGIGRQLNLDNPVGKRRPKPTGVRTGVEIVEKDVIRSNGQEEEGKREGAEEEELKGKKGEGDELDDEEFQAKMMTFVKYDK